MEDDTAQPASVDAKPEDKAIDSVRCELACTALKAAAKVTEAEAAVQHRSGDGLRKAAEYVAAELIRCIDIDQAWRGWAHKYRGHFRVDHSAYRTLGDALDALRDALRSRQSDTDESRDG